MWTAPPPAWIPSTPTDIRNINFQVLNGSTNVALRWNYTLDGEVLWGTAWNMDGVQIASLTTGSIATINDNRFDINASEVATLIIKDVGDIKDATFQCVVQTNVNAWKDNIKVEITGKKPLLLLLLFI